jgi:hypothetical protein
VWAGIEALQTGPDVRFFMMIVCGIKLFNIILFLSSNSFAGESTVSVIL